MYNKLFTKILDSSIWLESEHTRIIWLTFIASMDQDGFAQFASVRNLAHRARVSEEDTLAAVAILEAPDTESSDPDNDGRRVEKVPGGWMVLNSQKYKELVTAEFARENNRIRVKRHRAKKCNVTPCNDLGVTCNASETEAETNTNEEGSPKGSPNIEKTDMNQKSTEPSPLILSLQKKKRVKIPYPAKNDLLKLWSLDYPPSHGGDSYHYVDTKDDKPVDDLLSRYSPAQIMERAQRGWASQKQFIRDSASTFYGLNRYWNEIGNETRAAKQPVKLRKLENL